MNLKNSNYELGFDKFEKCRYDKHWSFSNFNRKLIVAAKIAALPKCAKVLEVCSGHSGLRDMVRNNFARPDIEFTRVDADEHAEAEVIMDITSADFDKILSKGFHVIVFMEAIEHISFDDARNILEKFWNATGVDGMLILTTPTPPSDASFEDRVWPDDHEFEYTLSGICNIVNKWFKVEKRIGWSLEEREFNELLEKNREIQSIYCKLKGAYPESYIRALISSVAPVEYNRQVLLICKKRRVQNG